MRLSLRLALVFSFYGLALAGGFQYLYILSLKRQSYRAAEIMAGSESEAVRILIRRDVANGDWPRLQKKLGQMIRQTGIASIYILNFKGQRLIGRADDMRWINRHFHKGLPMGKCVDGFYDIGYPLLLPRHQWGQLMVSFHTDVLENRLRHLAVEAVGSGATAFLAITLLAWLMGDWVGYRLERLVPRIEALARDPENFKPIKSEGKAQDEAGRLISAFNSLGASLKSEMRRRRELEEEKAELSAMLVHDLKSPLTVMRSGTSFLHEQISEDPALVKKLGGNSGIEKIFKLLNSSLERLHRMVEDILQLSRMEEMPGLPETSSVDLSAMIRAAARDFELVARARGQKVSSLAASKRVPAVLGDPILLRRVLDNLLYNAIEHAGNGGEIQLAVAELAKGVRVSVSDSGLGVPKEARKDIFKKFVQKDMTRHVGNVGLGLALCEKVILRHGGTIGIEDAKPHGACFYFILPHKPI